MYIILIYWQLFVGLFLAQTLLANTDIRTTIFNINYRGTFENAGRIAFAVNGDDYAEASPKNPIFIRIRLDRNARLSFDRVGWPGRDHGRRQDPIYLVATLHPTTQDQSNYTINMPPDTISIVRWLGQERAIWIRVQHSSSSWLMNELGVKAPPSPENGIIEWTIGMAPQVSQEEFGVLYQQGLANLPGNTRNLDWAQQPYYDQTVADTRIIIEVSASTLTSYPDNDSILAFDESIFYESNYDTGSTGIFTAATPEQIERGILIPIGFPTDEAIARGWNWPPNGEPYVMETDSLWHAILPGNDQANSWDGLALANPQPHSVYLNVRSFSQNGTMLEEQFLTLAPHAQHRMLLEPADQPRWVKVGSNWPIGVTALHGNESDHEILTIPVFPTELGNPPYLISHVPAKSGDWENRLILANPNEEQLFITVDYISSDGFAEERNILPVDGMSTQNIPLSSIIETPIEGGQLQIKAQNPILGYLLSTQHSGTPQQREVIIPMSPL